MEIKGKRIILRQWKQRDAKQLQLLAHDKGIARFTTIPYPYKLKHAKEFIKRAKANMGKKTEFCFAIFSKERNLLGGISVIRMEKKNKKAEIGYWLGRKHRGKGYMSEAMQLMLGFAFKKLKLNRMEIKCSAKNRDSRKVIEKTGAVFEGIEREGLISSLGKKHDALVYSILAREFRRKN